MVAIFWTGAAMCFPWKAKPSPQIGSGQRQHGRRHFRVPGFDRNLLRADSPGTSQRLRPGLHLRFWVMLCEARSADYLRSANCSGSAMTGPRNSPIPAIDTLRRDPVLESAERFS